MPKGVERPQNPPAVCGWLRDDRCGLKHGLRILRGRSKRASLLQPPPGLSPQSALGGAVVCAGPIVATAAVHEPQQQAEQQLQMLLKSRSPQSAAMGGAARISVDASLVWISSKEQVERAGGARTHTVSRIGRSTITACQIKNWASP